MLNFWKINVSAFSYQFRRLIKMLVKKNTNPNATYKFIPVDLNTVNSISF
jgi:hypothetical protein